MENETRNQKLLRELNESLEENKAVAKGMSPAEKKTAGILIGAAVALAVLVMWIF